MMTVENNHEFFYRADRIQHGNPCSFPRRIEGVVCVCVCVQKSILAVVQELRKRRK